MLADLMIYFLLPDVILGALIIGAFEFLDRARYSGKSWNAGIEM